MSHFQDQGVSCSAEKYQDLAEKTIKVHKNVTSIQRPGDPRVQTGQSSLDAEKVFQISQHVAYEAYGAGRKV